MYICQLLFSIILNKNGDSYRIDAGNNHDKGGEKPS